MPCHVLVMCTDKHNMWVRVMGGSRVVLRVDLPLRVVSSEIIEGGGGIGNTIGMQEQACHGHATTFARSAR